MLIKIPPVGGIFTFLYRRAIRESPLRHCVYLYPLRRIFTEQKSRRKLAQRKSHKSRRKPSRSKNRSRQGAPGLAAKDFYSEKTPQDEAHRSLRTMAVLRSKNRAEIGVLEVKAYIRTSNRMNDNSKRAAEAALLRWGYKFITRS